jgi:hypothetical protein
LAEGDILAAANRFWRPNVGGGPKQPGPVSTSVIRIVGARENNLRNVSVDIPK